MMSLGNSIMQNGMQNAMEQEYGLFQQNPQQYLLSKGLNIPMNALDNPQSAVQYIISSGQGTNAQLAQFQNMPNIFRK